jgi:hypothetical protein
MRNFFVIISAFLILIAGTVSAQMGDEMGGHKMIIEKQVKMGHGGMCGGKGDCCSPMMMLKMADELGLTAEQKTKISKMQEDFGILRIDKNAELEKAQLHLGLLMKNDGAEKEILAAMDKVGALKTEMKKMCFTHHRQMKAVLTADQLKKLEEMGPKMMGCGGGDDDDDSGPGMGCGSGHGEMGKMMAPDAMGKCASASMGCKKSCGGK